MRNSNPELNVQNQWLAYLKRGGLREEQLSDIQRSETNRAFYGGFGQAIIALRDDISDDEDVAIQELQNMHDQVLDFFQREVKDQFGK
jgi:hypothetical protein